MKRIALFLATNLAVIVLLGIILRLIGFEGILDALAFLKSIFDVDVVAGNVATADAARDLIARL
jgi:hypothetical protein